MGTQRRTVAVLCLAGFYVLPAVASADERFAVPIGGAVSADCLESAPCDIQTAVEGANANDVVDTDVVTLLPGTYTAGTAAADEVQLTDDITVRGKPGQARPVLSSQSSAGGVALLNVGATLKRLEVNHNDPANGTQPAVGAYLPGTTIEEVVARSTSNNVGAEGCEVSNNTVGDPILIRDTICSTALANFAGLAITSGAATTVRLVNVTAVAPVGTGLFVNQATSTVNATNVIASGGTDINAQTAADVNLDHSNYDLVAALGGATITPVEPTAGFDPTNQTAPPIFADAFQHQAANSPTVNAGAVVAELGATDVDGDPRNQGTAPDIGADEFSPDGDGDGVPDFSDNCPAVSGPVPNNGCPLPDTDGDGLLDINDNCPAEQGPSSNNGCPVTTPADADGDGIPDTSDTCPNQAAPGTANGCPASTADTTAPETTINKGPKGTIAKDSAFINFSSSEEGSTFRCKLDKGQFKVCKSPKRIRRLADGRHTFKIVAIDAAGNEDATPASLRFRVKTEKKKG